MCDEVGELKTEGAEKEVVDIWKVAIAEKLGLDSADIKHVGTRYVFYHDESEIVAQVGAFAKGFNPDDHREELS